MWKPKPRLHGHVRAHIRGTGSVFTGTVTLDSGPPEPGTQIGETFEGEVPPGMHVTDDDYMLAQMKSRDSLDQFISGEIKPDLIIDHLSELLAGFRVVGKQ